MIPDVFIRRRMYTELGGYPGYRATPARELTECRISIIAEINKENEDAKQQKDEAEEVRREAERTRSKGR